MNPTWCQSSKRNDIAPKTVPCGTPESTSTGRVHTTLRSQKVITFYDYFS